MLIIINNKKNKDNTTKMAQEDIEYLKLKMQQRIINEQYESAEKIKQWIIELGGDPELEPQKELKKSKNDRG